MIPDFGARKIEPKIDLSDTDSVRQWELAERLQPHHTAWKQLVDRTLWVERIAEEDLVRVVAPGQDLSAMWEHARAGDMLFRTFGSLAFVKGLRRVCVARNGKWMKLAPKKRNPAHEVTLGRVLANHVAQMVLGGLTRIAPKVCIIVEGESDFLTWCCLAPDAMVIGICNGCWNAEIAAFIPKTTCVVILTDMDIVAPGLTGAGCRYAAEIGRTLGPHKKFRYVGKLNAKSGKNYDQNGLLCEGLIARLEDIKPLIKAYTPPPQAVVEVKRVDPEAGRRAFGGDQQKRVQWWQDELRRVCGELSSGAYNGNRSGALKEICKFSFAIKDGLLYHSDVKQALELAYVAGQPRSKAFDRRKIISDALR